MNKLIFETGGRKRILEIIKKEKNAYFSFLNAYSIFLFKNVKAFRDSCSYKKSYVFPDGITISLVYFSRRFKRLPRTSGPVTTEFLLKNKQFMRNKKHFFIDGSDEVVESLINKLPYLNSKNTDYYNPPHIKGYIFSQKETREMIRRIKKSKPDYIWIGVGNPRQEILASQLIDKVKVRAIFNVGAAIDFLSGAKKEAPRWVRELGLEWLFRLVTDFKYSLPKVIKSFKGFLLMNKYIDFRE